MNFDQFRLQSRESLAFKAKSRQNGDFWPIKDPRNQGKASTEPFTQNLASLKRQVLVVSAGPAYGPKIAASEKPRFSAS